MSNDTALDHPFWRYSLSVYSQEGVPAELIALQDTFDIDVNVALFCLWLGKETGLRLTGEQLDSLCDRYGEWNGGTVVPMRTVRRYLKTGTAAQPVAQRAADLRNQVKRLELLAEQIEQALLYDWFCDTHMYPTPGDRDAAEANLTLFMCRASRGWTLARTREAFTRTLSASDGIASHHFPENTGDT